MPNAKEGFTMIEFTPGKTYATRSICDHDCIISATIAQRTAKTITTTDGKRFRLSTWNGVEQFKPWGSYSMAPILSADKRAALVCGCGFRADAGSTRLTCPACAAKWVRVVPVTVSA